MKQQDSKNTSEIQAEIVPVKDLIQEEKLRIPSYQRPSTVSDSWLLTANLDDIALAMEHCKGLEIASWLSDNADKNTRYVIIVMNT